jgi:hypothetical protein
MTTGAVIPIDIGIMLRLTAVATAADGNPAWDRLAGRVQRSRTRSFICKFSNKYG